MNFWLWTKEKKRKEKKKRGGHIYTHEYDDPWAAATKTSDRSKSHPQTQQEGGGVSKNYNNQTWLKWLLLIDSLILRSGRRRIIPFAAVSLWRNSSSFPNYSKKQQLGFHFHQQKKGNPGITWMGWLPLPSWKGHNLSGMTTSSSMERTQANASSWKYQTTPRTSDQKLLLWQQQIAGTHQRRMTSTIFATFLSILRDNLFDAAHNERKEAI